MSAEAVGSAAKSNAPRSDRILLASRKQARAALVFQQFSGPRTAQLAADRRIGLLGGGGHCTLRRFRSRDYFIDADHEGVLDGS